MVELIFNPEALIVRLGEASRTLADMTPVHLEIGEYMVTATRDRFRTSTAPDGSRWQAKSAATLARYLAAGDGNKTKPLVKSGRLGQEIAMLASRDEVEVGSALEYSGVMQDGAEKGAFGSDSKGRPLPWGRIPARVWLGLSDSDERSILDIVDSRFLGPAVGE